MVEAAGGEHHTASRRDSDGRAGVLDDRTGDPATVDEEFGKGGVEPDRDLGTDGAGKQPGGQCLTPGGVAPAERQTAQPWANRLTMVGNPFGALGSQDSSSGNPHRWSASECRTP